MVIPAGVIKLSAFTAKEGGWVDTYLSDPSEADLTKDIAIIATWDAIDNPQFFSWENREYIWNFRKYVVQITQPDGNVELQLSDYEGRLTQILFRPTMTGRYKMEVAAVGEYSLKE